MENQNSWKKPLTQFGIIFIVVSIITLITSEWQFHPLVLGFILLFQAITGCIMGLVQSLSRKSDSDTEANGQKLLLLSLVSLLISFGVCAISAN